MFFEKPFEKRNAAKALEHFGKTIPRFAGHLHSVSPALLIRLHEAVQSEKISINDLKAAGGAFVKVPKTGHAEYNITIKHAEKIARNDPAEAVALLRERATQLTPTLLTPIKPVAAADAKSKPAAKSGRNGEAVAQMVPDLLDAHDLPPSQMFARVLKLIGSKSGEDLTDELRRHSAALSVAELSLRRANGINRCIQSISEAAKISHAEASKIAFGLLDHCHAKRTIDPEMHLELVSHIAQVTNAITNKQQLEAIVKTFKESVNETYPHYKKYREAYKYEPAHTVYTLHQTIYKIPHNPWENKTPKLSHADVLKIIREEMVKEKAAIIAEHKKREIR